MKKLMSLGCLMALIFAGASAFATVWFDSDLPSSSTPGNGWTAIPESWGLKNNIGSFKDWDNPLTYQAESPVAVATNDATVTTSLMFTAIDGSEVDETTGLPVDLAGVNVDGAKAGLTVVEKTEGYRYYGLYNGAWAELTGATPDVTEQVTVKIALCKYGDGAIVKYSVVDNYGDHRLTPVGSTEPMASVDAFQTIEFLGNCPAIASLNGQRFANGDDAKESITPTSTGTQGIPATISYNRQDLLERNIDPDDAAAVEEYLTTARENGLHGWVNTALGIDDNHVVAVESNVCAVGSITLDYGFLKNGTGTVSYQIDTEDEDSDATISTEESGIHTVKVFVTGEDGETKVQVGEQQVGVMNTGKNTSGMSSGEKTFDIVAVPFEAFKGDVTVANVLNTAELNTGDMLYILKNGQYDSFTLTKDKKWESVGAKSYSRDADAKQANDVITPEGYKLTSGDAIWIERDVASKIVFTGKGETNQEHSWTWESGEYSLVANPTINDFVLPLAGAVDALGKDINFGKNGDMIIVEDVANPQQFEKKDGEWGEWVTTTKTVRGKKVSTINFMTAAEAEVAKRSFTIPAGIGFWYYNKGGSGDVTINFGKNN